MEFPTKAEAEYSAGLCEAIATAIVGHGKERLGIWCAARPLFTEVFAGPRAPLSLALARLIGGCPFADSSG